MGKKGEPVAVTINLPFGINTFKKEKPSEQNYIKVLSSGSSSDGTNGVIRFEASHTVMLLAKRFGVIRKVSLSYPNGSETYFVLEVNPDYDVNEVVSELRDWEHDYEFEALSAAVQKTFTDYAIAETLSEFDKKMNGESAEQPIGLFADEPKKKTPFQSYYEKVNHHRPAPVPIPQRERDVLIVNEESDDWMIEFYATPELAQKFEAYGHIVRLPEKDHYRMTVDPRFDYDMVYNYIESYEG